MKLPTKKLLNTVSSALIVGCTVMTAAVNANELDDAQDKLKATFSNFSATHFKDSPIPGLFEVHTSTGIIYFSPESETLIFGRIFDKDGNDLTQVSLSSAVKSRMNDHKSIKDLLDSGVKINEGGSLKMTVFSNPDCGYCQQFERWIKDVEKARGVKIEQNIVFLRTTNFPDSESKMRHIICSEDRTSAYESVRNVVPEKRRDCPKADEVLSKHDELINFFGIQGTPSFLLESGEIVSGLNTRRLSDVIEQHFNPQGE